MNLLQDNMASDASDILAKEKNLCLKLQYKQKVKDLLS